ncbi:MAG: hypothetical protein IKI43_01505 [Campylobacter sp.]|nr:hypothetical protein [Campylobacter sp.]MBR7047032.1 hypothetical protein [Campylobacter sp.]
MEIKNNDILEFAKFFTPISHTNGRIRVRVSPKIKELKSEISENNLKAKISQIKGIKEFKFNAIIGSLTIFYDENIFPKRLWDDFLKGDPTPELIAKINDSAKDLA